MAQFLGAAVLKGIDQNFQQRAERLMAEAQRGAKLKKPNVALKQWWHDLDLKEVAGETLTKGAAGFGVAAAGAAIAGAGVAAGAVTFGIGPALGLVVGLSVTKGIAEYKYQSSSNRLRRAIKAGHAAQAGDPDTFPIANLGDAVSKVLKKYLRVARRGKMLKGGAKGVAYNLRHLKTTISAQFGAAAAGAARISAKYDDRDLNERLLEFRYYGQMTLNALNAHLDTVVGSYKSLLEQAGTTYVHIMRQVHFAGNHKDCSTFYCFTMSQAEFRRNVAALRPAPAKGNILTKGYHEAQHFKQVRKDLGEKALPDSPADYPNVPASTIDTRNIMSNLQTAQRRDFEPTETSTADLIEPGDRVMEYGSGVLADAGAGGATKKGAFTEGVSAWAGELGEAGEPVGQAMGGAAASAGMGLGLDVVLGSIKERYDRRKARNRVLGNKSNIAKLLEAEHAIVDQEMQPLIKLIQADDKAHALRVVEKITWYIAKITELESRHDYGLMRDQVHTVDFSYSVFSSCTDAYNCWYSTYYLIRQYIKAIANIVFLEIILLQLDRKLATMDIGITRGNLIADGTPTPVRPAHMKEIDE